MMWNDDIDLAKRATTTRMIIERARARGWDVAGFETNTAISVIRIPGREQLVHVFSASPPQMSFATHKITKDKVITNQLLAAEGLPVPDELITNIEQPDKAALRAFIERYGEVVVKPMDGSHGKGITVGVTSLDQALAALHDAQQVSEKSNAIVQQQVPGFDLRVICIDYTYVSAITRLSAAVVGDGEHTIRQLVDITNSHEDRGLNYKARLNIIPIDKVERYLGVEALERVPAENESVQVIGVSNIGMGGVRHNVDEVLPDEIKRLAEQVTKALQLPVSGIDFMVDHVPVAGDTIESLNPVVIEANGCPQLVVYDDLSHPRQIAMIDGYLDYLGKS